MGLNFGVVFLTYIPASLVVGLYCTKTKKVRWITVLAFIIFIVFFACMSTTNAHTRNEVWGFPVLMGAGLSMTLIALVAAGQLSVPPDLIAVASGIMISMRSLGGTIGIAICKNGAHTFTPLLRGAKSSRGELTVCLRQRRLHIRDQSYPQQDRVCRARGRPPVKLGRRVCRVHCRAQRDRPRDHL